MCGSPSNDALFLVEVARACAGPRCYHQTMERRHYLVALLLAMALAACRTAPAARAVDFDREIQLAPSELVVFGQQELYVELVRVVDDSRCPTDVTCVWAGEVKVQLSIRIDAAAAVQQEIVAGQHATVGGFRLLVVQVRPDRISTRAISPEEYRVTLRVERVRGP